MLKAELCPKLFTLEFQLQHIQTYGNSNFEETLHDIFEKVILARV